jgi:hypothetical protein
VEACHGVFVVQPEACAVVEVMTIVVMDLPDFTITVEAFNLLPRFALRTFRVIQAECLVCRKFPS